MAKRSEKCQEGSAQFINTQFDGGLNYSQAPSNIADNELTRGTNIIYNSQTGKPETRPGTVCVTATALADPILKIYEYEKSSSAKYIICASGGKLYYLNSTAWVEIGSLNDSTTTPSFLTYHALLLIADGGTNIKTWDGTTYSALDDALKATALAVIKGRVVANSGNSGSNDLVTLSGPYNEGYWNTATEGAVALRAGYGDNMAVNGFAVFGDDLIISKKGDSRKKTYRLNVSDATTSNWYVQDLTDNNCSQNAHTICSAFNNVYFVDSNGFKSLKGVTEYGDLQVDVVGSKVNTVFGTSVCDEVTYVPLYTAIWYPISDRIFVYHRIYDVSGNMKHAFTDLTFNQGQIRSICQSGNTVYLAGNNGYLYSIDSSKDTDETAPGVTSNYQSILKTKRFSYFGGAILRKTEIYFSPISSGAALLYAVTPSDEKILLKSITLPSEGQELSEATGDLYDATEELSSMGTSPWYEISKNRVRGSSIQWQLTTTSGRVGVEGLKAEVALVEG
jgi:hypothetical protein